MLRLITIVSCAVGCGAIVAAEQVAALPPCLMTPPVVVMTLPKSGFTDIDGPQPRACSDVPARWQRGALPAAEVTLDASGPEGSGRYWTITIGLAPSRGGAPSRGVCLQTSTAGFRSLRSFNNAALPWLADRNGDASAEVVLWASFFLTDKQVQSESGLVAWVYRVDAAAGTLTLDWRLTRALAREVAAAYRTAVSPQDAAGAPTLAEDRVRAANALEAFAAGRCSLPEEKR